MYLTSAPSSSNLSNVFVSVWLKLSDVFLLFLLLLDWISVESLHTPFTWDSTGIVSVSVFLRAIWENNKIYQNFGLAIHKILLKCLLIWTTFLRASSQFLHLVLQDPLNEVFQLMNFLSTRNLAMNLYEIGKRFYEIEFCDPIQPRRPARMRNSWYKKSHNFQRLSLFSILYDGFLKFSENWDKEFKFRPMYFNSPRTGNHITSCI